MHLWFQDLNLSPTGCIQLGDVEGMMGWERGNGSANSWSSEWFGGGCSIGLLVVISSLECFMKNI